LLIDVDDSPGLKVIAEPFWPGDGLEVHRSDYVGLEEPAAAHLLDREEGTAEVDEVPELRVVVLLQARDHAEIQAFNLMRVEEPAAAHLLDREEEAAHVRQHPVLGVVVLELPGDDIEVQFLDLVSIQEQRPYGMLDGDYPLRLQWRETVFRSHRDILPGDRFTLRGVFFHNLYS
jgi:hypothetical protein